MKKIFYSTFISLPLLLLTNFSHAYNCPSYKEEGKWGSKASFILEVKSKCEAVYNTVCSHDICYNGLWDSIFGTGHKCNEVCTAKFEKTVVTNTAVAKYYNGKSTPSSTINLDLFHTGTWFGSYINKENDKDKNYSIYWFRLSPNNNKKLEIVHEAFINGINESDKRYTLNKL